MIYDLDEMIKWWDVHGTFPGTVNGVLDWNHIDGVQWGDQYFQNVKDTRQMLRELLDLSYDGLMRPRRLIRLNPVYEFTVEPKANNIKGIAPRE